ncbi:MAG: VOC family protein [Thalassobaculaceae bacterium]|nr:VOC family protein [Thalassobaculaceae bacterium]
MAAWRQLPTAGETFLDHLGHFVPDMDAAHVELTRLGFLQTPYVLHAFTDEAGQRHPMGTANRCVMLREGYLEVLTVTDASTPTGDRTQRQLDRYTGVHIVAMTDPDAIARRARQAAAGFHPQEPTPLKRPVPVLTEDGTETGSGEAAFTVIKNPETDMPEGRVQVLSHHTEALVWQEAWMRHENGIVALRDVIIVPQDMREAEDRYARFTEVAPVRLGEGLIRYPLARGGILLATPERAADLLPGAKVPPSPGVAGYALLSDDVAATRRFLEGRGFAPTDTAWPGVFSLPLSGVLGSCWLVAQDPAALPWNN